MVNRAMKAALAVITTLALARVAAADATVPAPAADPPADPLARCTMEDGPLRRAWASKLDDKARAAAGDPSVALTSIGRRHLLLARWWPDKPARTILLRAGSLERAATIEGTSAAGMVETDDGALVGLLAIDAARNRDERLRLLAPDGTTRWSSPSLQLSGANTAVAVTAGDVIIVSTFHRIASGSDLVALDAKTGALRWRADVAQLGVPHSAYWNDVTLARDGARVILRGFEAGGCYEQTFDVATGRRLSSRISRRW
jgi:hypothetical protein